MTKANIICITILLVETGLYGCKSDESVVNGPMETNLITNSSFESGGNPSLQGWDMMLGAFVDTIREAPEGGGTWSIAIRGASFLPVPYLKFTAAAPIGTHVYQFSLWAKYIAEGGLAELRLKGRDTTYVLMSILVSDTAWTWYAWRYTIGTSAGDSLQVALRGAYESPIFSRTFFDLCRLDLIN